MIEMPLPQRSPLSGMYAKSANKYFPLKTANTLTVSTDFHLDLDSLLQL
jgi:hypothetical protein